MTKFDELGSAYLAAPMMDFAGEDATYRPFGSASRAIKVVVDRDIQQEPGAAPVIMVDVRVDAEHGVTMAELDRGQDELELAFERATDTPTRRKIASYTDPVGGFVTLEVR